MKQRLYPKEEFVRRGGEIFEEKVEPGLALSDEGKYVAIDIESGEWEMDPDEMAAGDRLLARLPDAQVWMERVGYGYVHRFSYRVKRVPL
jgi:hypothetical protein